MGSVFRIFGLPCTKLGVMGSWRVVTSFICATALIWVVLACFQYTAHAPGSVDHWRGWHGSGGAAGDLRKDPPSIINSPIQNRFESNEAWRQDKHAKTQGYKLPTTETGYPKGSEKIFFMIKTGGTELWERLPTHLYTTIPQMKNLAIYSDAPGSIGGHEVVDILQNITEERRNQNEEFKMYRLQREMHDLHGVHDYGENDLNQGWSLDRYKNVPILYDAWLKCPDCEWFVMIDADTYIMVDNLARWLGAKNHKDRLYLGGLAGGGDMFAHGGSGIVVSQGAVHAAFANQPANELLKKYEDMAAHTCCGDLVLGEMLKHRTATYVTSGEGHGRAQRPGTFLGEPYWETPLYRGLWCKTLKTFHKMDPHHMQVLWEWEKSNKFAGRAIQFADLYRDFIMPYIDEERANWDNLAQGVIITEHGATYKTPSSEFQEDRLNSGSDAWQSAAKCRQHCEQDPDCLSWRYLPQVKQCGVENSVRVGRATHKHIPNRHKVKDEDSFKNNGAVSGWMIDRIRAIRQESGCDNLADQEKAGVGDRKEGWWLRATNSKNGLTQFD